MKEDQNKRKNLIMLMIGVFVLLLIVIGATYAFFQAQIGTKKDIDVSAQTGTTDVLTFKADEEGINILANEGNFNKESGNQSDETTVTATLTANNTNNLAKAKYNVYFVISKNSLIYTKGTDTPELIMEVTTPDDEVINLESDLNIEGLKYHTANTKDEPNDVSGYDITNRVDTFAIATDYPIEVKEGDSGKKEQTWKVKVTLVNLKEDQRENEGKELTGEILITTDKEDAYELAHIKTATSEVTNDSITITLEQDKGNKTISKYYYGIEEIGEVSAVSMEDVTNWEEDDDETHTFTKLNENTNYKIYAYAVDEYGFKSNEYETEANIATDKLPEVGNVSHSEEPDSITVTIDSPKKGSNDIAGYEYRIKGGTAEGQIDTKEETTSPTHTFTGLSEQTQYTIEIRIKDSKGLYSQKTTLSLTTSTAVEPLEITNVSGEGLDGKFNLTVSVVGGTGPYTYSIVENSCYHCDELSGTGEKCKSFARDSIETSVSGNEITISGLDTCLTHKFKIKVVDSKGSETTYDANDIVMKKGPNSEICSPCTAKP